MKTVLLLFVADVVALVAIVADRPVSNPHTLSLPLSLTLSISVQCTPFEIVRRRTRSLSLRLVLPTLYAVLIQLRAWSEGANHNTTWPNRLVEQLIETVVGYGNLKFAVG